MENKIASKLQNIAIKPHLPLYGSVFFTVTSITVVNINLYVMVNVERRNQSSYHQFLLSDVQLHLYGGTTDSTRVRSETVTSTQLCEIYH